MSDPNEKQVGGSHYKGRSFQTWDLATTKFCKIPLGHFETSAIAYLVRFREKNGLQDLDKVLHYIDKMLWEFDHDHLWNTAKIDNLTIHRFLNDNKCDVAQQREAVRFLITWTRREELQEARKLVEELIEKEFYVECSSPGGPDDCYDIDCPKCDHVLVHPPDVMKPAEPLQGVISDAKIGDIREGDIPIEDAQPKAAEAYTLSQMEAIIEKRIAEALAARAPSPPVPEPPKPFRPLPPFKAPKAWDKEDGKHIEGETVVTK